MHLKSLTLRGFKSFASSTTLRFEPGVTAVVGPNGSGKSNVVDAIAWVMGEQGAKSLRGGKMEDVIFAGTSGRAPLGRAEVILTIDNSDGSLPIDYTEVTLSRIMFRNGGSEYFINGEACRLLDIQELLSDSGIGREMHVIVGQGQLDAVLSAGPEERRGFVEEAAGVLKHRKRKEKALRKLDSMEGNLTRLTDLTTELRRQLKPLGRQAEIARRASVIQADLRDARLRLLADDLLALRSELAAEVADETALRERRAAAEAESTSMRERESLLEAREAELAVTVAAAQEIWFRLQSLNERVTGLASLAAERRRHLSEVAAEPDRPGRDPGELDAEAARVRSEEQALTDRISTAASELSQAEQVRGTAEDEHSAEERRVAAALQAAADRREGLARLSGQVAAARSRVEARQAEIDRLVRAHEEAQERARSAQSDFAALEAQVAGLDDGEIDLDSEHAQAAAALSAAEQSARNCRDELNAAEKDRSAWEARHEALRSSLARRDGSGALLAPEGRLAGVRGTVAELIQVRAGDEAAVAAALGPLADAIAVADLGTAIEALAVLKEADAGRAGLLVAGAPDVATSPNAGAPPAGTRWVIDSIDAPADLMAGLRRLLAGVAIATDTGSARRLIAADPDLVAVTADGDRISAYTVTGGSASGRSAIEAAAAVDEAAARLTQATARLERARFALTAAESTVADAAAAVEAALQQLNESDARMSAVAEQLAHLGASARAAAAEAHRVAEGREAAETALQADESAVAELTARLTQAESAEHAEPSVAERDRLAVAATAARAEEVEARLRLRTLEERARSLAGRAGQLEAAAAAERRARADAIARRQRAARDVVVAAAVLAGTNVLMDRLADSLAAADRRRRELSADGQGLASELVQVRQRLRAVAQELTELTDSVHRDEVARAEQRLRIEQVEQRSLEEFGVAADTLITEYGPDQPVPPSAPADGEPVAEDASPRPYVRTEQEKRARAADRDLRLLGRVNPLALEEFSAMEERHRFLTEQLEDLKRSKRDLLQIVREVDDRIQAVFAEAYADVEREFRHVFSRLFPGGEGRLVLTEPGDLLNSGIEVEARPPGKKVKRLSLLSGGERSLTAVAFLVALFKARPSPFYILDEVEAALDDTNLGRLLTIYEELRENSQLIVITHQKRTMEVADALYGVSMRGDGVSTVISQRLREAEPA